MNEPQDRRTLMAIVLSVGVVLLWQTFFAPTPVEPPPTPETLTPAPSAPAPSGPGAPASTLPPQPAEQEIPPHEEPVTKEGFRGRVASSNGSLGAVSLTEYTSNLVVTPLWTWAWSAITGGREGGWDPYSGGDDPYVLLTEEGALGLAGAGSLDGSGAWEVRREGDALIASRTRADGLSITKTLRPGEGPDTLALEVRFDNRGQNAINDLWIGVADEMSGEAGRFSSAKRPLVHAEGDVEHIDDLEDLAGPDLETFPEEVQWLGLGDRYFMAVLIPQGEGLGRAVVDTLPDGRTGAFLIDGQPLDAGASRTHQLAAFLGPKDLDLLKPLGHELEDAVEYGWFGFFSRILLFLLELFQKAVVNWGLAIILLTFLVKLVFFPLTQKAFASSARMQALQPMLNDLREKYKDNRELQTQQTMKLFQEQGVNPLGGCLPTLVQLPVWFALYNTMLFSVELYDTSFLYIRDLTSVDPYGVIPTLYAGLMFAQQRMMPMGSMDEAQQRILKMMPLIFAFFMYSFPSGLVLYFCVNIALTILQQWWIKRNLKVVPAVAA